MTPGARVLVLGGTGDGVAVAEALAGAGFAVTYSLAGRTRSPRMPPAPAAVRVGGFGGVPGLVFHLRAEGVDVVVDATHPFAAAMSVHASQACVATGVPLVSLVRPGWAEEEGDDWRRVPDLDAAAALAPTLGRRILLTIGRQEVARFVGDAESTYLVRAVEAPDLLPPRGTLLLERGPFTVEHELDLLRDKEIDVLVTKDSGGAATGAKLVAARSRGIPVVVVDRPPPPPAAVTVSRPDEVRPAVASLLPQSG